MATATAATALAPNALEKNVQLFETKKNDNSYKYGRLLSRVEKSESLIMAHHDGELLHYGTHKGLLVSWNLEQAKFDTGAVKEVQRMKLIHKAHSIAPTCMDTDRDHFYFGDTNGGISMFHRGSSKCLSFEADHKGRVAGIKKLNNSLVHIGYDGFLLVRNMEYNRIVHSWIATKCPLSAMVVRDENSLIVGSWDSGICQLDLRGKSAKRFVCEKNSPVRTMKLHEEGNILVTAHGIGGLRSWDLRKTDQHLFDHGVGNGHTDVINTILFEKDRFFTGADDCSVRMFDINRGKCLDKLVGNTSGVISLCFGGDLLISSNCKSFRKHRMTDIINAFNQTEELEARKAQAAEAAQPKVEEKDTKSKKKKKKGKR